MESKLFNPKILKRKRIERQLRQAIQLPLCIVSASMGFGKTITVREFLKEIDYPAFWCSLRENEISIKWLWGQIIELLKKESESNFKKLSQMPVPYTAQEKIDFIFLLKQVLISPVILIFDDYQENKQDSLDFFIQDLIDAQILNLHIIIITREYPKFIFHQYIINGTAILIEQMTLSFTRTEIYKFFLLNMIILTDTELNALYEYTEGWILALYLLIIEYEKNGSIHNIYSINQLLKTVIFDMFSEEEKEIIIKLSPLDSFTMEEAIFITELEDCRQKLQKCAESNEFIQYNLMTKTFRMHNILRTVANEEFVNRNYSIDYIWYRRGLLYEQQQRPIYAIQNYRKGKQIEAAFYLIESENSLYLYLKEPSVFEEFFETLSFQEKANHLKAYLIYLYFKLLFLDNRKEHLKEFYQLEKYYEKTYEQTKEFQDKLKLGEVKILSCVTSFNHSDKMLKQIKEAFQLLDGKQSKFFDDHFMAIYTVPEIFQLYYRKVGYLKQTVAQVKEISKYYLLLIGATDAGWEWVMEGEYQFMIGEIQEAMKLADMAMKKAIFRKKTEAIISTAFLKMRCCIYMGKYKELCEVKEIVKECKKEGNIYNSISVNHDLVMSYINCCIEDMAEIADWIANFELISYNNIFKMIQSGYITYGKILIFHKRYVELEALAESMITNKENSEQGNLLLHGRIYYAVACHHLFNLETAKKEMEKAIQCSEPDGIVVPFMENAIEVLPILLYIQKTDETSLFLKNLISHCQQYENGLKVITGDFKKLKKTKMLTEREIEILDLVKNGDTNREISTKLHIANVTVEKTLTRIYKKMGVQNRKEAIEIWNRFQ